MTGCSCYGDMQVFNFVTVLLLHFRVLNNPRVAMGTQTKLSYSRAVVLLRCCIFMSCNTFKAGDNRSECDDLEQLLRLVPAANDISAQDFADALRVLHTRIITDDWSAELHSRTMRRVLQLPLAQEVQPLECFEMIRCHLSQKLKLENLAGRKYDLQLPGLQAVDSVSVGKLMVLAAGNSDMHGLTYLASLSGAEGLDSGSLCDVLVQLSKQFGSLNHHIDDPMAQAMSVLLSVPASQQLSADEADLVMREAATSINNMPYLSLLCKALPAVQAAFNTMDVQALKALLVAAAQSKDSALLLQSLAHPQAVQLQAADMEPTVLAAVRGRHGSHEIGVLHGLPGTQQLDPGFLVQVLEEALMTSDLYSERTRRLHNSWEPNLMFELWVSFPPVLALTAPQLMPLLLTLFTVKIGYIDFSKPTVHEHKHSWGQLLQLPSLQALSQSELDVLVEHMLGYGRLFHRMDYIETLLQLPNVHLLSPTAITSLTCACADYERWSPPDKPKLLLRLLGLPGALKLTLEQVLPWLQKAVHRQSMVVFDLLLQLPVVAAVVDAAGSSSSRGGHAGVAGGVAPTVAAAEVEILMGLMADTSAVSVFD